MVQTGIVTSIISALKKNEDIVELPLYFRAKNGMYFIYITLPFNFSVSLSKILIYIIVTDTKAELIARRYWDSNPADKIYRVSKIDSLNHSAIRWSGSMCNQ